MKDKPRRFIVFEGIDGSGKTTQAEALLRHFQQHQRLAILSPEPTDGPIGQLIRKSLKSPLFSGQAPKQFEAQMGYLFAADRHYHLYQPEVGVLSRLAQGYNVITTRYWFSSLAYNAHSPEDWQFIRRLNEAFPLPDWVIYLDLPVEIALSRLRARQQEGEAAECYEKAEKLKMVANNYSQLFADYAQPLCHLDATQSEEALYQHILAALGEK